MTTKHDQSKNKVVVYCYADKAWLSEFNENGAGIFRQDKNQRIVLTADDERLEPYFFAPYEVRDITVTPDEAAQPQPETLQDVISARCGQPQGELDPFIDKPTDAQKSVREAWQRAADKHGEAYANDIFPDGKPEYLDQGPESKERKQYLADTAAQPQPPQGIYDERSKTWIKPSGTVKQGRRPMYRPNPSTPLNKADVRRMELIEKLEKTEQERDQARAELSRDRDAYVYALGELNKLRDQLTEARAQVAALLAALKGLLSAYAPNAERTAFALGEQALQSDVQRARAAIAAAEKGES